MNDPVSSEALTLYGEYSRSEIHSIFSPDTTFTPQSGTWGLHGIVPLPNRPEDFVFFVTFGSKQGSHVFDEGITTEGLLSWQSQPQMDFESNRIKTLIRHDDRRNIIHLFLRTEKRKKYTYLGPLRYLLHDNQREKPVFFQWQLLNWPIPEHILNGMNLSLNVYNIGGGMNSEGHTAPENLSTVVSAGTAIEGMGVSTFTFQTRKTPDYLERDARNRKLGLVGEEFILAYERTRLSNAGMNSFAGRVRHVSLIEGDGAGYDILSYDLDGAEIYIEVKTTEGPFESSIFMSSNELAFANTHAKGYRIYRVYDFDVEAKIGKIKVISGDLQQSYTIRPTNYLLRRKSKIDNV